MSTITNMSLSLFRGRAGGDASKLLVRASEVVDAHA
jgi:hypothetical protein